MAVSEIGSANKIQMDYMKLLVTQMQNQNPLEPMNNDQMTSQLTQISQLEQMESQTASFAKVMNRKARSLGMRHSNFLNPHGLTASGQYSTARDMAICARAVYSSATLRGIISTKAYTFRFSNGRTKLLENTNRVLKKLPYCNGMKTGTTRASGRCLISSGTLNGRTAIVVVLGTKTATVWTDSEKLLRWALERPASR